MPRKAGLRVDSAAPEIASGSHVTQADRSQAGEQAHATRLFHLLHIAFFTALKESLFWRISFSKHLKTFQQCMWTDKYHLHLQGNLASDTSLLIAGKSKPSTRKLQTKQRIPRCAWRLVPAYLLLLASLFDTRPR